MNSVWCRDGGDHDYDATLPRSADDICATCGATWSGVTWMWSKADGETPTADPINPSHYKSGTLEAIQVIEAFALNYNMGSACKYLLRAGKKGPKAEDLRKCIWFLEREIKATEKP